MPRNSNRNNSKKIRKNKKTQKKFLKGGASEVPDKLNLKIDTTSIFGFSFDPVDLKNHSKEVKVRLSYQKPSVNTESLNNPNLIDYEIKTTDLLDFVLDEKREEVKKKMLKSHNRLP